MRRGRGAAQHCRPDHTSSEAFRGGFSSHGHPAPALAPARAKIGATSTGRLHYSRSETGGEGSCGSRGGRVPSLGKTRLSGGPGANLETISSLHPTAAQYGMVAGGGGANLETISSPPPPLTALYCTPPFHCPSLDLSKVYGDGMTLRACSHLIYLVIYLPKERSGSPGEYVE